MRAVHQIDQPGTVSHPPSLARRGGARMDSDASIPSLRGMRCRFQSRSNVFSRRWSATSTAMTRTSCTRSAASVVDDPTTAAIVLGVLLAVAGVGALIAGVALQLLIVGIVGFALMFAGVLIAITPGKRGAAAAASGRAVGRSRRSAQRSAAVHGPHERPWDRRQDGQR